MIRKELLTRKIEDLRMNLETVIEEKEELINPEVVKASQSMDKVLIQYYRVFDVRGLGILKKGGEIEPVQA